jgi:hypothetical protein
MNFQLPSGIAASAASLVVSQGRAGSNIALRPVKQ